jgi:hypothetical protein
MIRPRKGRFTADQTPCSAATRPAGDIIAFGTTDVERYGTTPTERAKFILDTIRVYLARQACTLHRDDLSSIATLLGREIGWCPACGIRLSIG